MTKHIKFFSAVILLSLIGLQCKKESDPKDPIIPTPEPATGTVMVNVKAYSGTDPLVYGTTYTNANSEQFKVSMFRYYLTNIVLMGDGTTPDYVQPESYYLVDHGSANATYQIKLDSVPKGTYKGIKFIIGVDSLRNVSGAQTGALDPGNGMFWTWSSGYIQFKLEGTTVNPSGNFAYHIGGFKGAYSAVKENAFVFTGTTLQLAGGATKNLNIQSDVQEVFKNPAVWNIASMRNISTAGASSKTIADNYADMIRFGSIQ
ncbi:MAG: hypothetical protein K1X81_04975 [Bacteroidia bacterium]|nr:hypothetical protein [Bacteroidia bacterium]